MHSESDEETAHYEFNVQIEMSILFLLILYASRVNKVKSLRGGYLFSSHQLLWWLMYISSIVADRSQRLQLRVFEWKNDEDY